MFLSLLVGGIAFTILKFAPYLSSLDRETRASLAAHYGSVSLGTLAAVLAFLDGLKIEYNPMVLAWVALMELPAILLGIMLLGLGVTSFLHMLRKDQSLLLLPVAFTIGAVVGPQILHTQILGWVFENGFEPVLAYFLFEMGRQAGENLRNLKGQSRWAILLFGIGMPVVGGVAGAALGAILGKLIQLSFGEVMILSTLGASASYVAAPTAMSATIAGLGTGGMEKAQRAVSTSLTASVGITLPFNIVVGLPLYREMTGWFMSSSLVAVAILLTFVIALLWVWRNSLIGALNLLFQTLFQSLSWQSQGYQKSILRLTVSCFGLAMPALPSSYAFIEIGECLWRLMPHAQLEIDSFSGMSRSSIQRDHPPPPLLVR
jgi:hypothetical protein